MPALCMELEEVGSAYTAMKTNLSSNVKRQDEGSRKQNEAGDILKK